MSDVDRARLEQLLGGERLARLRVSLRRRLEWGGGETVTLSQASDDERRALDALLGRRARSGRSLRIPLARLEAVLQRAGVATDLAAALEALDGPLVDRRRTRAAAQARWEALVAEARSRAQALDREAWLEDVVASGLLKRLAGGDPAAPARLLDDALAVLERLPAEGTTRSALAAEALGDAHALDRGRPVATLVRRALTAGWTGDGVGADEAELWGSAGVLVGGHLTSVVLALELPAAGDTATARAIAALNHAGEPIYLTLRQLLREPPAWRCAGLSVFACENPVLVAEAATHLGSDCPPLVSVLGRPRAAAWVLLDQLRRSGARLHYHGDLDWAGIAIANALVERAGVEPWRMDAPVVTSHANVPGRRLRGRPVAATWDPSLTDALEERGAALEEEQLLEPLLADLAAAPKPRGRRAR